MEIYKSPKDRTFPIPEVERVIPEVFMKTFTIIMPAYNEIKRIPPVLNDVCSFIYENDLPWEVIVSIDGNDGTDDLVNEMTVRFHFLHYIKGNGRNGKGSAIKNALNLAKGEYVILMDADGAIGFKEIVSYLRLVNSYDLVNFDRYRGKWNNIPKIRRFVSRGYNLYIRLLFNLDINDTQCGYKIMRTEHARDSFSKITITNGFFYVPLFVHLKKMGVRTVEVNVKYQHSDGSKFSLASMILGGFVSALAFRIRESPLWKFIPKRLVALYYKKFRWI